MCVIDWSISISNIQFDLLVDIVNLPETTSTTQTCKKYPVLFSVCASVCYPRLLFYESSLYYVYVQMMRI